MSAGALKRRSLFHGQRKRQKKTAAGRTMAENLIRKQLKLTFLVIQTKRGKNSTRRRRRERRRRQHKEKEEEAVAVVKASPATHTHTHIQPYLLSQMQMKSFCLAEVRCVTAASFCQPYTSCRTTFWAQVDEECNGLFFL